MADDNTLRSYRIHDPYQRGPGQPEPQESAAPADPLAELARLIGQTDPFADPGHAPRGHQPSPAAALPTYADVRAAAIRPEPVSHGADPQFDSYPAAQDEYPQDAHAGYDPHGHGGPEYGQLHHAQPYQQPAYRAAPSFAHGEYDAYAAHGGSHYGEQEYDDPPPSRRKNGLLTAATLIGCALLGTAGAYAYRTMYAEPGSVRAPVIVADRAPAKVVPNVGEAQNARSQDRVDDPINERLMSREEQPVSLPPPGTASSPRVVVPSPVQPQAGGAPQFPPAQSSSGSEPRRVRTVTIRNGNEVSEPAEPPAATGRAAPPPASSARASQPQATPQAPRAPQPTRQASRSNEPLSLDPTASAAAAPEPARVPQRPVTAPAPRLASTSPTAGVGSPATATAAAGGYVVQVSSQRSEADARASFKALQTKYPQVLNGRQAIVKRADLGAKGVYYRAMVGPFGSQGDASQFCNSLKAAGGQCIIQRN